MHEHIPVERQAHVTGTKGKSYSRQSITGRKAALANQVAYLNYDLLGHQTILLWSDHLKATKLRGVLAACCRPRHHGIEIVLLENCQAG